LTVSLEKRRIPFVVVSGYDKADLPSALRSAPFVSKPIALPVLMEVIQGLHAGNALSQRAS
jgi:hypothetical protein